MKGYIQVYTGDGKGKTTAAIGLAIRSIGAGHRVCIIQFMKSLAYSEQKILKSLPWNYTDHSRQTLLYCKRRHAD